MWKNYLERLTKILVTGSAREESLYPVLKTLLEDLGREVFGETPEILILPRKTSAGSPDLRVSFRGGLTGYVEAKFPGTNLDRVETSDQLRRYRETFDNLLLTDFFEFRLYRRGEFDGRARLASPETALRLKEIPPTKSRDRAAVRDLLFRFLAHRPQGAGSPAELAGVLARLTRLLREEVLSALDSSPDLRDFYEAFRKTLISDLTPEDFADLYAQTVAYGLFAARLRAGPESFSRETAYHLIPRSVGVLRDIFRFLSLGEPGPRLSAAVEDLACALRLAAENALLRSRPDEDPVVHFYETFLAVYDPETRERRGVYYTPGPVVDYIARAVHEILKTRFGLADGLASPEVTLLDPAAGTLAFVARAVETAADAFRRKYGSGALPAFLRDHILKHFFAFELLAAPYAIGHLKMALLFEALGTPLSEDERFPLYLTNALEMEEHQVLPGLRSLAEESRLAHEVKTRREILVVLGNPPYSVRSANVNPWTKRLLREDFPRAPGYYAVDGEPLRERNPKSLQDDYVKFLRFAQWKIARAGRGLTAMITNHGYLDNVTFRGMRRSLMETFDEIYVLDLHGNALRRERAPDGGPDENVFDIRQGVAIGIFVRLPEDLRRGPKTPARVFHAELWGRREEKYRRLSETNFSETPFAEVSPAAPFYFFVPRKTPSRYLSWPSLTEIFPVHNVGFYSGRDRLTMAFSPEEMWARVLNFVRLDPETAREAYQLGRDTRDWKVRLAQEDLRASGPDRSFLTPVLYRPFDLRWTYYTGKTKGFLSMPCFRVLRNMLSANLGLTVCRQISSDEWRHVLITEWMVDNCCLSNRTRERAYLFPLYLYAEEASEGGDRKVSLWGKSPEGSLRRPNLSPEVLERLSRAVGRSPAPEEVLAYVYAVLWAPAYRRHFHEALRADFPRIPLPEDAATFEALSGLGRRLIELHLLKAPDLDPPAARFEGQGDGVIRKVRYDPQKGRLYLNQYQYFAPVPPEVWEFRIGGYRVAERWLRDRRGRELRDPRPYLAILTAVSRTLDLLPDLDPLLSFLES